MLAGPSYKAVRGSLARQMQAGASRAIHRSSAGYSGDRYLVIRDFFTRQAAVQPTAPAQSSLRGLSLQKRWNQHSVPPNHSSPQARCAHCPPDASVSNIPSTPPPPPPSTPSSAQRGHAQNYAPFIKRLIQRSSSLHANSPHRPTKDELLEAASSWWQRLRIRIKWFTIRGWRKFNTDDLSAFASFFVLGNTIWILIGTTTFVSAVFATLNSLSLQEYVARWISDYMTSETGVTVIFESAIVPRWGASTICFRNVYISRRPSDSAEDGIPSKPAKAATAVPPSPTPFLSSALTPETVFAAPAEAENNYTMFDVNLEEVEVTLSFMRWLDGKGLIKDAKIKGVRGVIDRRSVWWDLSKPLIPAEWRHATRPGDFELESLQIEDALITVYHPGGQRPFNVSIFNASIGPFRKRWLFYDMISAEGITGQYDNCLFSLHMPQKLDKRRSPTADALVKRMARLRIDGLPIEHAQYASGHTGPISWITSGKLDAVLDIKFPFHPDEQVDIKAILGEISRNVITISHGAHPDHPGIDAVMEQDHHAEDAAADTLAAMETAANPSERVIPGQARLARPALSAPRTSALGKESLEEEAARKVIVDIDLRFRDLKAQVPMFTSDLSVTNNALIRPIVAFINANRTLVPIHCRVEADLADFDGSWTMFETGLMSSVSDQMYEALAHHVSSQAANTQRIKQVSVWGIQRGAEVLLDTLRSVMDPVHSQTSPA